jgi:hypothetical protein
MSDPRVEGGPNDRAEEHAESPLGPHVRASGRRSPRAAASDLSPEFEALLRSELGAAGLGAPEASTASGAGTAVEAGRASDADTPAATGAIDKGLTSGATLGGLRGGSGGLRARPHGVRTAEPPATVATPSTTPDQPNRRGTFAVGQAGRIGQTSPTSRPDAGFRAPELRMPELHMPALHRPRLHRPTWPLSIRQTVALVVAVALIASAVSAMVVVIPNKPVATPATGVIRQIDFSQSAKPPVGNFDYGPYFVDQGTRLVMIGTDVNVAADGTTTTTTTVWSTTDGSTWNKLSADGSFGSGERRFVVQGFSDDGNGGLAAVGNATGAESKVEAEAWHSRDGVTWTSASVDFPSNVQMVGLAVRSGQLVSAGNGVAWFSRDGTSWNLMSLPNATGYLPRVVRAWSGGFEILAISSDTNQPHTATWVSQDGHEWIRTADMAGFKAQDLVAYGNGLVAVGSQTLTQKELATPTPQPTPTPSGSTASTAPSPTPAASAAPSGSGAVATPSPTPTPPPAVEVATSWISPDGANWYRGSAVNGRSSLALESITQVYDSLVAVASEPGAMPGGAAASATPTTPGATPTPARHASLWISEDGLNWRPMTSETPALSRGRLTPFGNRVILSGFDESGTFDVLVGGASLGSPMPVVAATTSAPFGVALKPGAAPMVPGVKADSSLGPLVVSQGRFLVFVNNAAGTTIYSSSDGRTWTPDTDPKALTPTGATGVPVVSDAIDDGEGGIVAVGGLAGDTPTAAAWHHAGTAWTAGTITVTDGAAPTSLGSVALKDGNFVAAASSDDGARLLFSRDGQVWQAATISGADGYELTVTSWANGFIASGSNGTGTSAAWTSPDGRYWVSEASWKLPASLIGIYGTRTGLIATSASIAGGTSWWWSIDGRVWQDSQLTTAGGCWTALDSNPMIVSAPRPGTQDLPTPAPTPIPTPTPKPTPKPTGSVVPTPSPMIGFVGGWSVWATKDAKSWQQATTAKFGFDGATACRVASSGGQLVIVGWAGGGVLRAFTGPIAGQ